MAGGSCVAVELGSWELGQNACASASVGWASSPAVGVGEFADCTGTAQRAPSG